MNPENFENIVEFVTAMKRALWAELKQIEEQNAEESETK